MRVLAASLLVALAMTTGGCGGSEETSPPAEKPAAERTETASKQTAPPAADLSDIKRTPAEEAQLEKEYADASRWRVLKKAAGDRADQLIIPVGTPPEKKIVIRDLRKGKGPTPEGNDQIKWEDLAFDYSEAHLGEDSWGKGEASWWIFEDITDGVQAGLKGMRPGGIRELIIPAALLHDDDAAVYLVRLHAVTKQ
jgi:peptidylprolyl isomerase